MNNIHPNKRIKNLSEQRWLPNGDVIKIIHDNITTENRNNKDQELAGENHIFSNENQSNFDQPIHIDGIFSTCNEYFTVPRLDETMSDLCIYALEW